MKRRDLAYLLEKGFKAFPTFPPICIRKIGNYFEVYASIEGESEKYVRSGKFSRKQLKELLE